MNPFIQLKQTSSVFLAAFALACFGLLLSAQAVSPTPDGCYPGYTTAEGCNALNALTTGLGNTGLGWRSLFLDTTGNFNTGVGGGALALNNADSNTAVGAAALLLNTTGFQNVAVGTDALVFNTTGTNNTAVGFFALFSNTNVGNNFGGQNTAVGAQALFANTIGFFNTADGAGALAGNATGNDNTANGAGALAVSTGNENTAVGFQAGVFSDTGSNNVYIGSGMGGVAGESNACYIASIFGQTSANGIPVLINSSNKLGTTTSSKRFKEEIKPMDKASEELFALKPVSFHYKKQIDPAGISQLGLVAEDVEKVNPDLVVRDKEGKPYSVRYDQVNAMLLNEFLKEHRKVDQLEKQVERLTAGLQKVTAQLEMNRSAPQTVLNNQ